MTEPTPESFRALRIHQDEDVTRSDIETLTLNQLSAGDIVIRVRWSSLNYKDALAATGEGKILRTSPLNGGIDAAGTVIHSNHPGIKIDQAVLVTGYGLSQTHDGGYADYIRVPGEWVIPLPNALDPRSAMILGTAGLTAALALHRLELNGVAPTSGPILVSGASGGVGSIAINLLSDQGYQVIALSGKPDQHGYLKRLGADDVLLRTNMDFSHRPLQKARWAGAIDTAGGAILDWLISTTQPWGCIASIGMAAGTTLNTSVMPFILRGVGLLGITSAGCPTELRHPTHIPSHA